MKKGFTLVELLAVIVILAVILVIAVPQINNVIKQTKMNSLGSTAKIIAAKAEEATVENEILENNEALTCANLVKLDDNYGNCTVSMVNGKGTVTIVGANKFAGITCTGTKENMNCTESNTSIEPIGNYIVTTTTMSVGSAMPAILSPSGTALRTTASVAINDWKLITGDNSIRVFYLKHNIDNDVITESYVEFVINDEFKTKWKEYCYDDEICEAKYDNLVNGTYTLKGGVNESSAETKTIYNANIDVIKEAFSYATQPNLCYDDTSYFGCYVSGLNVYAYSSGDIYVGDDRNLRCSVRSDGSSKCEILYN